MLQQLKIRISHQVSNISLATSKEVIYTKYIIAVFDQAITKVRS
ncbi:hypothetical protein MCEZLEM10_01466 [Methylophilaceae bacterium]